MSISDKEPQYMQYSREIFTFLRKLCFFRFTSATLVFSASPIDCQHMLLLSLSLYCMCRLSQISGYDSYKHISPRVSSFVHTFFSAMFAVLLSTHALNYTGFPGLVQVAAESKCGASLHGHRKCLQVGCPLVNGDVGEAALEGGYT